MKAEEVRKAFYSNANHWLEVDDEDAGGCDACGHPGTVSGGMNYAGFLKALRALGVTVKTRKR